MKNIPAYCQMVHEAILLKATPDQRLSLQNDALEGVTQLQTVRGSAAGI
jgi:hypothetical protein